MKQLKRFTALCLTLLFIPAAFAERPDADLALDSQRKPKVLLELLGVAQGQRVLDLEAGGGYNTELLAAAVGASGEVLMQNPPWLANRVGERVDARLAQQRLPNVRPLIRDFGDLGLATGSVDRAAWIMGPHELWFHPEPEISFGQPLDVFQELARVLKPGGRILFVDHAAAAEAPLSVGGTLHRISEGAIEALAEASGLSLVARSSALRNADDDRRSNVFAPEIRGNTDRFILVFEKPQAP